MIATRHPTGFRRGLPVNTHPSPKAPRGSERDDASHHLATLAIAAMMLAIVCGRPARAGETPASAVNVTALPQGEREIAAVAGASGYVLRLAANGEVTRLADLDGNVLLETVQSAQGKTPALAVFEAAGNAPVAVKPTDPVTVQQVSPAEVKVEVTRGNNVKLTYLVQPERLKVAVEGPAGRYLVRGCYPCRMEGARVLAPDGVVFPSAGIGAVPGAEQSVIDAGRTRALTIVREGGDGLRWTMRQVDIWGGADHLVWEADLAAGQTLQLSATAVPLLTGPVRFGLFSRALFRPTGTPAAVIELDSANWIRGQPRQLKLPKPLGEIVPQGRLLAALLPAGTNDPVTAGECGAWFSRTDRVSEALIPVSLKPAATPETWEIAIRPDVKPAAYRLRVWIVPADTPLPEALGGPKGGIVGYVPGFSGRSMEIKQPQPTGDVLVTVADEAKGSLNVLAATLRRSFHAGDRIPLLLEARGAAGKVAAQLRVAATAGDVQVASTPVTLEPGAERREYQLATSQLAPGTYTATLTADGLAEHPLTFEIVGPLAGGMPNLNSPMRGPADLAAVTRLGVNGWVDIMASGDYLSRRWPAELPPTKGLYDAHPALPRVPWPGTTIHDELVRENMLFLLGQQSARALSFVYPHSVPEHVAEMQRRNAIRAQIGRGWPHFVGTIHDYDVCGVTGRGFSKDFAYDRKMALLKERWEAEWEAAKAKGAAEADKPRLASLFHANVIAEQYRQSAATLHDFLPGQRHSTCATADHAPIESGLYLPSLYRPLDFRYLETWNDQIYANGAHDMQESFWTSLLRMGQKPGQPIWITSPTAPQPGTHFRRALETFARGATGTGYGSEGGAGLAGGWGPNITESTPRTAQERQTGELVTRYGSWLNQFAPAESVAILYSVSQGGTVFAHGSPILYAYYTLAQVNRPARLLTEDEIAAGALKEVKALLVVGQTAAVPAATLDAIDAFVKDGGKLLVDKNTKLELPGATKLPEVSWPGGLWPRYCNNFHDAIAELPRTLGAPLKAALGDIGKQPLEGDAVLVATKRAGSAQLLFVTNNREYPFADIFTPEQRLSGFYRNFLGRGGTYIKDVREPQVATLALREDLVQSKPLIYDVFAGKQLVPVEQDGRWTVAVDLTTLPGRVLLLVDKPLAAPGLEVSQAAGSARATFVAKSAVPLPIRLRVGSQEIYRAATPAGSCDTLVLGPAAGAETVELTELITGATQRGTMTLAAPATAALRAMPAAQLWDAPQIRKVLAAKNLAVYVDARQAADRDAAAKLAQQLGAELVFNPEILDYPVCWDSPADEEAAKEKIRQQGLLAWRRPVDPRSPKMANARYDGWPGALTPAPLWNRPVILFGTSRTNRLIQELDKAAQLQRPALPEYLPERGAVVQPVASPFWSDQHAVVLLCGDEAGRQAGFDKLVALAKDDRSYADATFSSADDGSAERRQVLGFEPPTYPAKMQPLPLKAVAPVATPLPVILPIAALAAVDGGVLAAVHSPGRNLARLDTKQPAAFGERWRTTTGLFYQPSNLLAHPSGEAVVSDGMFAWRHAADGTPRWKMLAAPLTAPDAAGRVWVRASIGWVGDRFVPGNLEQIDADGAVVASHPAPDNLVALAVDGSHLLVEHPGAPGRVLADTALAAVDLSGGRERWRVPNLKVDRVAYSADGKVIACLEKENLSGRDDIGRAAASRLTVLEAATGKVLLRHPLGVEIDHPLVTADGSRVIVAGRGFGDAFYVADVASGAVRRVTLPEPGHWARVLSADERELWVAGGSLYRINLETHEVATVAKGNFTALAARPGGGVFAGSNRNGGVAAFGADGTRLQATGLGAGLANGDLTAAMQTWRDAKLVGSAWLRPNEIGEEIRLGLEYPVYGSSDIISLRHDGVFAVSVTVRVPEGGRYRIELDVALPKDKGDAIKPLSVSINAKPLGETAPLDGNAWKQSLETDLEAGVQTLTFRPVPGHQGGWKQDALLSTMRIERK